MKRDYKKYFLGKRHQSAGYRLTGALLIFLYTFLIPAGRMHFHPTLWEAFGMKVEVVLFQSILLFFIPRRVMGETLAKNSRAFIVLFSFGYSICVLDAVVGLD